MPQTTPRFRSFLLPSSPGRSTDLGLLVLRLGVGLSMGLTHGVGMLEGFLDDPSGYPDPLGLGPRLSMGLMVFAELVCALLVAAGLFTRLAAIPPVIGMTVAVLVHHAGDPFGTRELAVLYLVAYVAVLCAGPGRFSLDRLLFGRQGGDGGGARKAVAAAVLALLVCGSPAAGAEYRLEGDLPRREGAPVEGSSDLMRGLEGVHGVLSTSDGLRLRTILTRPEGTDGRLPAILFVQWLSCDSVEVAPERTDGWSRMLRRVAAESGLVMLRTDKAGVGDSEGPPCSELGYDRELAHHRDALAWLLEHPWVDPERVVVFGASMGGNMAPLVAAGHDVAGVVIWGGGALPWRERTLGFERRFRERSPQSRVPEERVEAEMERIAVFLDAYLVAARHPREIAAAEPELGSAWELLVGTEGADEWTHYGRPPRFHQEAQARDWAAAWERVEAPVLALWGEYDWFESREGHALAVERAGRSGADARLVTFPGIDHHFQRYPTPEAAVEGSGGVVAEGPVVEEILAWLEGVVGPGDSPISDDSAAALVRRGLDALGGPGALSDAGGLSIEGEGWLDLSTRMQGTHPDRPERVPAARLLAFDPATGRVGFESHAAANPDADEWVRFVYEAPSGPGESAAGMLIALPLEDRAFRVPGDPEQRRRTLRAVPHVLLADALERRETLRRVDGPGDREAVAVTLASGDTLTLRFDPASGHLVGFEYPLDLPLRGDTTVLWEYLPHREVPGLGAYPSGHRVLLGDRPLEEIRYTTVRAGGAGAAVLGVPAGIEPPPPFEPPPPSSPQPASDPPGSPPPPALRKIADGVHLVPNVRGGFHPLVVELADAVVVVDAPAGFHEFQTVPAIDWAGDVTSSSVGRRLLEAVREVAPEKPIHLVLTHHHGDHAGGVRPFLAAGATIHASAVTARVVRRAARARFTLEPDELTGREVEPEIRLVEGETTISDGERSVRVLDVGENPHAEGVLVVHLPEAGILYQSDLFMPAGGGHFPDPARVPVMRWFVDWLDASGLAPREVYAIHGSARVTDEQLERIRRLAPETLPAPPPPP